MATSTVQNVLDYLSDILANQHGDWPVYFQDETGKLYEIYGLSTSGERVLAIGEAQADGS